MFFLAISLISTFFLGNDPNEVLTSHRWQLLGGQYLGYCTWRRRVSSRQLVFFLWKSSYFLHGHWGRGWGCRRRCGSKQGGITRYVRCFTTRGMAMLKSLMLVATQRLVASLSPGEVRSQIPLVLMVMVLDFSAVGWLVSWVFESQLASFINHSWASYFIQAKLQLTFVIICYHL